MPSLQFKPGKEARKDCRRQGFPVLPRVRRRQKFFRLPGRVDFTQIDEDLKIEKNEIIAYINHNNHLPGIIEVHDQYTRYKTISSSNLQADKIYTHSVYDPVEHEKELRRSINFTINANNTWYLATVSKSLEGTDDLIQTIIGITITLILLMLITTFFINRFVLRRLWQPFYQTLLALQQFNLSETKILQFGYTKIDEFNYEVTEKAK